MFGFAADWRQSPKKHPEENNIKGLSWEKINENKSNHTTCLAAVQRLLLRDFYSVGIQGFLDNRCNANWWNICFDVSQSPPHLYLPLFIAGTNHSARHNSSSKCYLPRRTVRFLYTLITTQCTCGAVGPWCYLRQQVKSGSPFNRSLFPSAHRPRAALPQATQLQRGDRFNFNQPLLHPRGSALPGHGARSERHSPRGLYSLTLCSCNASCQML